MQNAHIHDLTVTGTIYDGAIRIKNGGIVGIAYGNTRLTNCISNVTFHCIYGNQAYHGGLVGDNYGGLTIDRCAFTGKLLGSNTKDCGGFVGVGGNKVTISNSLFSPSEVTLNTQHCKTFVCYTNSSTTLTITNSYYTQTLGEAQGERGYRLNLASGITSSVTPMFGRLLSASSTTITKPFYRMNSEGSEIIPAVSSSIASMEGIFVEAGTDGETLTFSRATRATNDGERIVVDLSRPSTCSGTGSTSVIDRAIVRFGEGHTLPKFQLNPSHTKVYIPQDGKDYAVVSVGRDAKFCISTEIPLNFKAEENGTYTLSFSLENMDLDYLHLIDNMTGADVDLLTPAGFPLYKGGQGDSNNTQTVSYTFTAKTTDYASRFKLVFVCEDANDNNEAFAFINNGEIIINEADAHGASLQAG